MDGYTNEELQQMIEDLDIKTAAELAGVTADNRCHRSIQRDIRKRGLTLKKIILSNAEVLEVLSHEIPRLGPNYGRKVTTGHLRGLGMNVAEGRVGRALRVLAPEPHRRRQLGIARQVNPLTYHAPYFGYNTHIDQNEKLVDYGVVVCGMVDGASNFILGFNVMEHKNPIQIYDQLFKPVVETFGLFDCLISDCGTEFALIQSVQTSLEHMRVKGDGTVSTRPCMKTLRSTENNRIERIWVPVNDRCMIPLKSLLAHLHETGSINMLDEFTKNAVSAVARGVVAVLLGRLREAWNHHSIPRHGKPVDKLDGSQTYQCVVPSTDDAVRAFVNSGRRLTAPWPFGQEIVPDERRAMRDEHFEALLPGGFETLANQVLADDPLPLLDAINSYKAASLLFAQ